MTTMPPFIAIIWKQNEERISPEKIESALLKIEPSLKEKI